MHPYSAIILLFYLFPRSATLFFRLFMLLVLLIPLFLHPYLPILFAVVLSSLFFTSFALYSRSSSWPLPPIILFWLWPRLPGRGGSRFHCGCTRAHLWASSPSAHADFSIAWVPSHCFRCSSSFSRLISRFRHTFSSAWLSTHLSSSARHLSCWALLLFWKSAFWGPANFCAVFRAPFCCRGIWCGFSSRCSISWSLDFWSQTTFWTFPLPCQISTSGWVI